MIKILDKYKFLEVIEDNNSTVICNAINIETNEKIILKLFDKEIYDEGNFYELEENINSSNINKNSNLVKVYDVGMYIYNNTTYYAIALEYMDGKSLENIVENSTFNEEKGLEIIKQIISGLSELHNLGIMYRNLTCKNIYLDTNGLIKLDTTGYISTNQEKENMVDASTDIYLLGILFYKIITKDTISIDDRPSYINKEKFSTLAVSILEKSIYQDILHRYKSLNEFLRDIKLENNYVLGNFEENNKKEQKIVKSKKKHIKYIVGCIVLGVVFISTKALGNQNVSKVEEKNEQTLVLNHEEKIENDIEEETIEEDNISEDLEESTSNDNKESLNSNQIIQSSSISSSNNQSRPGTSSSNSLGSASSNKKPSSNSNSTNTQSKPSSGSSSSTESNSGSNSGANNESNSGGDSEQTKPEEAPEEVPEQKPEEVPEQKPEDIPDETPSETPEQNQDQGSEEVSE